MSTSIPGWGVPRGRLASYRLSRVLGDDGASILVEAEQDSSHRRVALKLPRRPFADPNASQRFLWEAEALGRLSHPGVAALYEGGVEIRDAEFGVPAYLPWIALELVEDATPILRFAAEAGLGERERLELLLEVCDAVQHGHSRGVLHLGLRPTNVLVDRSGRVRVVDFGVARLLHVPTAEPSSRGTATGAEAVAEGAGTPASPYLAPEHTDPSLGPVDVRADVHSLGALLCELLTGRTPGREFAEVGVGRGRKFGSPRPPSHSHHDRRLRGDLEALAARALARDPAERYPSVDALSAELRRYLEGEPLHVRPPSFREQVLRLARRHRTAALTAVVTALLLAVGAIWSALEAGRTEEARRRAFEHRNDARRDEAFARADLAALHALARHDEALELRKELSKSPVFSAEILDWGPRWLERCGALMDLVPELEERLREWEVGAVPAVASSRGTDPAGESKLELLQRLRTEFATLPAESGRRRRGLEAQIRELELQIAWEEEGGALGAALVFPDDAILSGRERSWRCEALGRLVRDLRLLGFEGRNVDALAFLGYEVRGALRERLERSRGLVEASLRSDAAQENWAAASEALAARASTYGALALGPSFALRYLGPDPESDLLEFVDLATGAEPHRDAEGRLGIEADSGVVFVLVPGGTVLVGAQHEDPEQPNHEPEAKDSESPVHEVELAPFLLAKHELTQGQWERMTGARPAWFSELRLPEDGGDPTSLHPLESVSWVEVGAVLPRWRMDFPTESQWEFACRGGVPRWWERAALPKVVGWTSPVTEGEVNPYGLSGLLSNVGEWCREVPTGYATVRPSGPEAERVASHSGERNRIFRGRFAAEVGSVRPSQRFWRPGDDRGEFLGVRPVRRW